MLNIKIESNNISVIEAFDKVYEKFNSMSNAEFYTMLNSSELGAVGGLLLDTDSILYDYNLNVTCTNIPLNLDFSIGSGQREYRLWLSDGNSVSAECSDNYYGFNEDGIWKKAA